MPLCFKLLIACRGYIAPEIIDKGQISLKSDIFSLGQIMIRLLTGSTKTITENVRRICYFNICYPLLLHFPLVAIII